MARINWQYLVLFLTYLSLALAASPTTFCKCTCFSNSTIIPFDSSNRNTTSSGHAPRVCNDCTKDFCLNQKLSICTNATEDDVVTLCFQRDSTKDELVIFGFIFATVGLLVWAGVKPYLLRWREGRKGGHSYVPVGDGQ